MQIPCHTFAENGMGVKQALWGLGGEGGGGRGDEVGWGLGNCLQKGNRNNTGIQQQKICYEAVPPKRKGGVGTVEQA